MNEHERTTYQVVGDLFRICNMLAGTRECVRRRVGKPDDLLATMVYLIDRSTEVNAELMSRDDLRAVLDDRDSLWAVALRESDHGFMRLSESLRTMSGETHPAVVFGKALTTRKQFDDFVSKVVEGGL